jgi:predicted O-methyltransferase YrrM
MSQIAEIFGYDADSFPIAEAVDLSAITGDTFNAELIEGKAKPGNIGVLELAAIVTIAKIVNPSTIFEIGTFDGRTTLNLAKNCPNSKIFTLDLPSNEATSLPIRKGE